MLALESILPPKIVPNRLTTRAAASIDKPIQRLSKPSFCGNDTRYSGDQMGEGFLK
jgi:hypothetical protein